MQQVPCFRDITIIYAGIYLNTQIPSTKIVSEYFKQQFKIEHNPHFTQAATQKNILNYKPLTSLKHYDVRLNSLKPQQSVKEAKLYFSSYNRDKRLYFYIIDEQPQEIKIKDSNSDYFVDFQLIIGGSVQRSRSLNIKYMSYGQLVSNLKYIFQIDSSQPMQLINTHNNSVLSFNSSELPQKKLRTLNLTRVGLKRVFTSG